MNKIKNYFIKTLLITTICTVFTSCASVIHGTRQKIPVATNPPGATISDGANSVTSPATLILKRDTDHLLTISKPGYATETIRLAHVIDGTVAGNLLLWPVCLIGWGVDAISGAQWRLDPETISVNLRPLPPGQYDESTAKTVIETKTEEKSTLSVESEQNK